tara:strand:+ start:140 stop:613 length:474 start_codon:yes stop_codon:yes gene_type:complete
MTIDPSGSYSATLHTNHGEIEISFFPDRSPNTVNNFLFLAQSGFYDGVIFHRVIPGFMIQGGDPTGSGRGGPGYRFDDELTGSGAYRRGTIAMANAGPDTNGSQFFICLDDVGLPHAYTIFGTVISGMDTVDSIALVPRSGERPINDCIIEQVSLPN